MKTPDCNDDALAAFSPAPLFGGWVSVAERRPMPRRAILAHWAWGETGVAWIDDKGRWRTPTMCVPQGEGDITHWSLMPLGPNSPLEDVEAMRAFISPNVKVSDGSGQ